jgi:hypothetical protein
MFLINVKGDRPFRRVSQRRIYCEYFDASRLRDWEVEIVRSTILFNVTEAGKVRGKLLSNRDLGIQGTAYEPQNEMKDLWSAYIN